MLLNPIHIGSGGVVWTNITAFRAVDPGFKSRPEHEDGLRLNAETRAASSRWVGAPDPDAELGN